MNRRLNSKLVSIRATRRYVRRLLAPILFASLLLGTGVAQSPFPDVPPCHWAAEAVEELAGTPERDVDQARSSHYLAQNAVHQVFEGLQCESVEWSRAFVTGAPEAWPEGLAVQGFDLRVEQLELSGDRATAQVAVEVVRQGSTSSGAGSVRLSFVDGRWLVEYESLRGLNLAVFP